MSNPGPLLIYNSVYTGASFGLIVFVTLLVATLFLRVANLLLHANSLAIAAETQAAFRRRVWRLALTLLVVTGLLHGGALLLLTWRQVHVEKFVQTTLARLQAKDWLGIGITALKALGVLLAGFLAARILVTVLHFVRDRLQRSEMLTGHQQRLAELLEQLRLALSTTILFGSLILCARLLDLPEGVQRIVAAISYLGVAFYICRFAVGSAHLAIDVIFGLSEALSRLESPLRYLGRFRHLAKLTKRAADYFLYVGIATWTIDQITPGTWAVQAGKLGLRIIAIFYLSRISIEVCVLMMNEFFLTRDEHQSTAEFQQRQTLVPVAASILRYAVYFTAVVMSLREAGIDPTPLLAGAGVAGVAVGLGAQSFVGDIVAGFFILFENLFLVGDFIEVSGVKGKVEEIAVRVTKIRDDAGVLHSIPNGEVRKVSSHSKGYVNVVIDIPLPYGENLHKIFEVLRGRMATLRGSQSDIIGETEFAIEDMRESLVLVRTTTMVKPGMSKDMSDVLRLAIWDALASAGIAAPYARRMLLTASQVPTERPTAQQQTESEAAQRTDIQRIKAYNLYLALDVDHNGYIEQADLDAFGRRLLETQRREPGTPHAAELRVGLSAYWNEMVKLVDHDHDGRISKEEFLQFCATLAGDQPGRGGEVIQALSEVLFKVCDRSDRGTLTETDFVQFGRANGLANAVANAGFKLIDRDGNGQITKPEWQRFMRDVFFSRKLNDAAAVVFGPGCRSDEE